MVPGAGAAGAVSQAPPGGVTWRGAVLESREEVLGPSIQMPVPSQ